MSNANDPKAPPPGATSSAGKPEAPKPAAASAPPKPPTPPPAAAKPASPPPAAAKAGFRLDPAGIMLGLGVVVLVIALWILWTTPRADQVAAVDEQRLVRIEQRLTALEPQAAAAATRPSLDAIDARLKALESRPAGAAADLAPIRAEIAQLAQRVGSGPATASNAEAGAIRQSVEALATRVQAVEGAASQRAAALEQQIATRLAALEQQLANRASALEQQLGQRVAAAEQAGRRVTEIEQRTTRLAALEGVHTRLEAGQPLGAALSRLQNPPEALARFANAAPPTDASLRLSFEDAAKAARAAADPGTSASGDRGTVGEAALARLSALVTVRRGEQVVWGDAAEGEIEKARRALAAGDIALALEHVGKLPPSARQAMQGWTQQAQALLAARAALRQLVTG